MVIQVAVSENFIKEIDLLIESGEVKNISQFAREMGMTPQTISEIKGQRQNVTTEILNNASRLYPSFSILRVFGKDEETNSNMVMEPLGGSGPIEAISQWMSKVELEIASLKEKVKSLENNLIIIKQTKNGLEKEPN